MNIGNDGIYRLYRVSPEDAEHRSQRLIGVFAIVKGHLHLMEDHDGVLGEMLPEGKLNDTKFYRMMELSQSPYWRLVLEDDIENGDHPDLLPDANVGGDEWQTPPSAGS